MRYVVHLACVNVCVRGVGGGQVLVKSQIVM